MNGCSDAPSDAEGGEEQEVCPDDSWTLVGVISSNDGDSWSDLTAWTDDSTFGSEDDPDSDFKSAFWSSAGWSQVCFEGNGIKITEEGSFDGNSLAELFSFDTLVSLHGTETDWDYNNGDFTTDNDHEFFLEIQNPPTTANVNTSQRDACIVSTAYDGWDRGVDGDDDTVQGFGCIAGSGEGPTGACGEDTCGDVVREGTTRIYIR
jgi:hypothetical protein